MPHGIRCTGATWVEDSFAYRHTLRRTSFTATDRPLLDRLDHFARLCWQHFHLTGYARVDFRIDQTGRPCLSPDAGFAAALAQAAIPFAEAMSRIMTAALVLKHEVILP